MVCTSWRLFVFGVILLVANVIGSASAECVEVSKTASKDELGINPTKISVVLGPHLEGVVSITVRAATGTGSDYSATIFGNVDNSIISSTSMVLEYSSTQGEITVRIDGDEASQGISLVGSSTPMRMASCAAVAATMSSSYTTSFTTFFATFASTVACALPTSASAQSCTNSLSLDLTTPMGKLATRTNSNLEWKIDPRTNFPTTEATTESPTMIPTKSPSNSAVATTKVPSKSPVSSTQVPSESPTSESTQEPSNSPTSESTQVPSSSPAISTQVPSDSPTSESTQEPSNSPTSESTQIPSSSPAISTQEPSEAPTTESTQVPSKSPTLKPIQTPSLSPAQNPVGPIQCYEIPTRAACIQEEASECGSCVFISERILYSFRLRVDFVMQGAKRLVDYDDPALGKNQFVSSLRDLIKMFIEGWSSIGVTRVGQISQGVGQPNGFAIYDISFKDNESDMELAAFMFASNGNGYDFTDEMNYQMNLKMGTSGQTYFVDSQPQVQTSNAVDQGSGNGVCVCASDEYSAANSVLADVSLMIQLVSVFVFFSAI